MYHGRNVCSVIYSEYTKTNKLLSRDRAQNHHTTPGAYAGKTSSSKKASASIGEGLLLCSRCVGFAWRDFMFLVVKVYCRIE